MSSISLIVRADDFGLCHAANQAILEGFESGLLTCASLMLPTPWLAEALSLARHHPEWELGLQLMLHCPTDGYRWGPVSGAGAVPSLVEPTGTFLPSLPAAARPEDIVRELDAQLERALASAIRPAYLEYIGEDHSAVQAALQQWSKRLGVPARMTSWGIQGLSLTETSTRALRDAVAVLQPGTYLWLTHPTQDSPETWPLWTERATAAARYADSRILCNPEARMILDQRGIDRISFRQDLEQRLGTESEE